MMVIPLSAALRIIRGVLYSSFCISTASSGPKSSRMRSMSASEGCMFSPLKTMMQF